MKGRVEIILLKLSFLNSKAKIANPPVIPNDDNETKIPPTIPNLLIIDREDGSRYLIKIGFIMYGAKKAKTYPKKYIIVLWINTLFMW